MSSLKDKITPLKLRGLQNYATINPNPSPRLQLLIAENALLAGDFRAAVTRYKNYLAAAVPGKEASDAATTMLTIMIDFMGTEDEAYTFTKKDGNKFLQTTTDKKSLFGRLGYPPVETDLMMLIHCGTLLSGY